MLASFLKVPSESTENRRFRSWISSTHRRTSHGIRSTTTRKLDPENLGVAAGILSLCDLELEMGTFHPRCNYVAKTVGRRVKITRTLMKLSININS